MKERNIKNRSFLGREHSEQSKLKMYLTSCLYSSFKLLDIEISKEKIFHYNIQAANLLKISEWTICTYKKSGAVFKNRWSMLAVDK